MDIQSSKVNTKQVIIDPFTGGISFQPYKDFKSKNPVEEDELKRVRS